MLKRIQSGDLPGRPRQVCRYARYVLPGMTCELKTDDLDNRWSPGRMSLSV